MLKDDLQALTQHGQPLTIGKATITPAPKGYFISFPWIAFGKDFSEDLKGQLPRHARRWNPDARAWWVSGPYLTTGVLDIVITWFAPDLRSELDAFRTITAIELIGVIE